MKNNRRYFLVFTLLFFAVNIVFAQKKGKKSESKLSQYQYQGPFCDGIATIKVNRKWGFIDSLGVVLVSPKYDEVEKFSSGLARVRMSSSGHNAGGWGLVNTSGQEIVPPIYEWIYDFENGEAKVKRAGQENFINRNGRIVR